MRKIQLAILSLRALHLNSRRSRGGGRIGNGIRAELAARCSSSLACRLCSRPVTVHRPTRDRRHGAHTRAQVRLRAAYRHRVPGRVPSATVTQRLSRHRETRAERDARQSDAADRSHTQGNSAGKRNPQGQYRPINATLATAVATGYRL
jgi:hypothetical protein